jgi:anaerobic magnesium-protoporphyrin IX monomethyl ester cyclase
VGDVIDRLASAGIAAEAMCFTDFPTETRDEALQTLDFLRARRDRLAVYIVGEFGLTHGSLVAQEPARFGIRETWELQGDELGLGIFFAPIVPWKSDHERADVDDRLSDLSTGWTLRTYPWAGAVSTAHTVLYYDRFGPGVFRDLAARGVAEEILGHTRIEADLRFDPMVAARAQGREASIWATLVGDERRIGRAPYEALAARAPALRPRAVRLAFVAGEEPQRVGRGPAKARVAGRRPSHASNATRS